MKKDTGVILLGDIAPNGNKHTWTRVISRGGQCSCLMARDFKSPMKIIRQYERSSENGQNQSETSHDKRIH